MTVEEFGKKYVAEHPIYKTWGEYVKEGISNLIQESGIELSAYLKVPASSRVKELDSIITKAFFRNKLYDDPYNQITDKVGVRFVVLLTSQITETCDIIERCSLWDCSKDRDYELERDKKPTEFQYPICSLHC